MPHIVLAFDPSTSIVCFCCQEGADELPFPVAALLCSMRSYAEQEGWMLEEITTHDCHLVYHKGSTGLLWVMLHSSQLLGPDALRNVLQAADAVTAMLLGPDLCASGHAAMKRLFKGISVYLEPLFQPSLQRTWPLAAQLLPHQTMLQPSAAASQLPLLLQRLNPLPHPHTAAAAGADAGHSSTAALLCKGCYCCATPSWQTMDSLQLLALQLIATMAAAISADEQQGVSESDGDGQCGQVMLHLPASQWSADGAYAEAKRVQLLWQTLQPGLQLCLLSNDCSLQRFANNTQQLFASCKFDAAAVVPLRPPKPALAVVVVDAGERWATFNTAAEHDGKTSTCFVQLAMQLQLQDSKDASVLLHTESHTVAGVAAGRGCKVYLLAEGSSLSLADVQQLIPMCVPEAVLLAC